MDLVFLFKNEGRGYGEHIVSDTYFNNYLIAGFVNRMAKLRVVSSHFAAAANTCSFIGHVVVTQDNCPF